MLGAVYHTGYLTEDLDKAVAFYEASFGGQVLARNPSADGGEIAYVKFGDSEVELIRPGDLGRLGGKTGLIIDHVGYFVPNLEKAMEELAAKGIKFVGKPRTTPVGYRIIYLEPDTTMGTRIHLTEKGK